MTSTTEQASDAVLQKHPDVLRLCEDAWNAIHALFQRDAKFIEATFDRDDLRAAEVAARALDFVMCGHGENRDERRKSIRAAFRTLRGGKSEETELLLRLVEHADMLLHQTHTIPEMTVELAAITALQTQIFEPSQLSVALWSQHGPLLWAMEGSTRHLKAIEYFRRADQGRLQPEGIVARMVLDAYRDRVAGQPFFLQTVGSRTNDAQLTKRLDLAVHRYGRTRWCSNTEVCYRAKLKKKKGPRPRS